MCAVAGSKPCIKCHITWPILDRLLSCTEIVRNPYQVFDELDELKRECTVRFRTGGWLANSGGRADSADSFSFG
jgi:hypothetical protein